MIARRGTGSHDLDRTAVPASPRTAARPPRVGAVSYLNSKPLIEGLAGGLPGGLALDYPSRLAAALAAGSLDVALIPSVEVLRSGGDYEIVSDACVAARGPVRSVKVYFRVPPGEVRTLALDEGSRTSAALARVLLAQRFGVTPATRPLPLDNGWSGHGDGIDRSEELGSGAGEPSEPASSAPEASPVSTRHLLTRHRHPSLPAGTGARDDSAGLRRPLAEVDADAVLLIGDRAMLPIDEPFAAVWDLGEEWVNWTGLPFVFAVWAGREGDVPAGLDRLLAEARDRGVGAIDAIARREAAALGLEPAVAVEYLRRNLHFTLGPAERSGLKLFSQLASAAGLIPGEFDLVYRDADRHTPLPPASAKRERLART